MGNLKQLIGEGRTLFASVVCILSCVLLAQAGTLSGNWTIYLKDGAAYSDETCEWTIGGLAPKGLAYSGGVWTLNNFSLNSTAPKGIVCLDKATVFKLVGSNFIKTGNCAESYICGICSDGDEDASLTILGKGSLSVTAGDYTGSGTRLSSVGISAVNLFVRDAALTATGGVVGADAFSSGIRANKSFVVIDATVTATGKQAGGGSAGVEFYGPVAILGTGKVMASSTSTQSPRGVCAWGGEVVEPAAVAKDANDNVLTYDADEGSYCVHGSTAEYADSVILTEGGVANYSVHLKDGKAYIDMNCAMDITSFVADWGLTCADGVWTMNNFNFTTRAASGLDFIEESIALKLQGENVLTAGSEAIEGEDQCGLLLDGDATVTGNGSLAVTEMPTGDGKAVGVGCNANLTVTGGAQLKVVSHCKKDVPFCATGDLTVGDATVEVSGDGISGTIVGGVTSVSGTLTTKSCALGFGSWTNTAPKAVATDADTGEPLYFGNVGSYFTYTNATSICSNVLMVAELPPEPIPSSVTAPANATVAVYTNGVLSADGTVLSNRAATVVYTANAGYLFADGSTAVTNKLDTTVNPAVDKNPAPVVKIDTYFLTFTADQPFGIKLKKGAQAPKVNLECSTDRLNWSPVVDGTDYDAAEEGGMYRIHFRGKGNTRFSTQTQAVYINMFAKAENSAATAIACSGNIETLLDSATVARGESPKMDEYAFVQLFSGFPLTSAPDLPSTNLVGYCYQGMFYNCASLMTAPALPATDIKTSGYCYASMFRGCTSLKKAPELPAKILPLGCYQFMFQDCTSLTTLPMLPATKLFSDCCTRMFRNCTSLVVNASPHGEEWKVSATKADNVKSWGSEMFAGTGGTLTSEPALDTAYYVASAPATFDVAACDHATSQASTNGVPAEVPCTVNYLTPLQVVYTAESPYVFPDGGATFTTNLTAYAALTTVALTADQMPFVPATLSNVPIVDGSGATNAVGRAFVGGREIQPSADGSYKIRQGESVTVVYEVTDSEAHMFGLGLTKKSVTLVVSGDAYAMTDDDKPKVEARWANEREIAFDTRERIVVSSPDEVVSVAYSTNFWALAAGEGNESVKVTVSGPSIEHEEEIVPQTNVNGYAEWKPVEGNLGIYTLRHSTFGKTTFETSAEIVYSQPFPLTVGQPAEGGSIVAITNGVEATGTFDVLGFEKVTIAAKPSDRWELEKMSVTTNGVEVALEKASSAITNRFEMPCRETVVTGSFVIARAYLAGLAQTATNSYLATSNDIERLRGDRLTSGEADAALASAKGALDLAAAGLAGVSSPDVADGLTNALALALGEIGTAAAERSAAKPWTITVDAAAVADGTNVFNTIDDAFAATDFLPYATNLVVIGEQNATRPMPAMAFGWNLIVTNWQAEATYDDAKSPYRQSRLVVRDAAMVDALTNGLVQVSGEGRILFACATAGSQRKAESFAKALQGRAADDAVESLAAGSSETTGALLTGELVGVDSISWGQTTMTGWTACSAPAVTNGGLMCWSVTNDNHAAFFANYDDVARTPAGRCAVAVDDAQTEGKVVGGYVIAGRANTAQGATFAVTNAASAEVVCDLVVGGDVRYVGAKAYSLRLVPDGTDAAQSNLVFNIAWGRFGITYDAMGPYFVSGETTVVSDSYVHIGYELPADPVRKGYVFKGWSDGVTNGAPAAAYHAPLCYTNEHTVFARWEESGSASAGSLALSADGTVTPKGDVGDNFVMPDTIGGKPVLKVGKAAFAAANYTQSQVTNLVTGGFLRSVEPGAFNGVTTLKTLTISESRDFDDPSNVVPVTIGKRAFAGTRIETLEIAEGAVIGEQAFRGCSYLREIAFFGDSANSSLSAANVDAFTLCGHANGTGKVKLYMSDAFKAANADFVAALTNSYAASNVEIADLSGYSPATSVSVDGLDVSQPTEMTLTVSAGALIAGTFADVTTIRVLYREKLSDPEREYAPTSVVRNGNGTYTVKFIAPNDGRSGFMRVIVR